MALLPSLPAAEWMLADRSYDADWFRGGLNGYPPKAIVVATSIAPIRVTMIRMVIDPPLMCWSKRQPIANNCSRAIALDQRIAVNTSSVRMNGRLGGRVDAMTRAKTATAL